MKILTFVYNGSVDCSRMREQDLLYLMAACSKFDGLQKLSYDCEKYLKSAINTTNMRQVNFVMNFFIQKGT